MRLSLPEELFASSSREQCQNVANGYFEKHDVDDLAVLESADVKHLEKRVWLP